MNNESRALALAPLITPFAFVCYALYTDLSGFNFDQGVATFIGLFLGMALASLPVAYVYMFFIGYRFYRLLVKKKRVNFFTLTLGGVFVADIPMLLIWPAAEMSGSVGFYQTFELFSFVGFMIGLTFWILLYSKRGSAA